ncbi:choice-of-anchor X domain-containing protein [Janthinobacterium sp. PSPC3-1]|uniref:choice-of-anchor X domain-containing protein n=1 Tax=Janthinobacterium sp. PSPC3-1 TaxID=2804653 RepID=UPI003CF1BDCC
MSDTPMQVLTRPFAIEPVTNIMMPDGIFDNALYHLRIAAHVTNMSGTALTNVTVYLESVGDPGIVPVARTFFFASIPAGAAMLVMWDANFQHAAPGKRLVSFVAKADGHTPRRSIQQIFVSQTRFDNTSNTYTCAIEEGTLTLSKPQGHLPGKGWGASDGKECRCPPGLGPVVPTGFTLAWVPNPAYAGTHGELPFSDPWWKVLAIIIAIIAALVAIIAAAQGAGQASFSVGGEFEETDPSVNCCSLEGAGSGEPEFTVAGVASAIASGAIAVACSDAADPFWRGQEATPPATGELTLGERVVAQWVLPEAPNAGRPYTADIKWQYERFTSGGTYQHAVSETQVNIHVAGPVETDTPAVVQAFEPLWLRASFQRENNDLFRGNELYAFALFQAPQGLYFVQPLVDDGLGFDPGANDGVYAASLNLKEAYRLLLKYGQQVVGTWRVFVFAQDVNLTKPGTPPEIAAQHIGGMFVASAIELTFDDSLPCPLKAQASIVVV